MTILHEIQARYDNDHRVAALAAALSRGDAFTLGSVHGSLPAVLISALWAQGMPGPRLVVAPDPDSLSDDLEELGIPVVVLTEVDEFEEGDDGGLDRSGWSERTAALEAHAGGALLLASHRAVEQKVPRMLDLAQHATHIRQGDTHDLYDLAEALVDDGYQVAPVVESPGQLAQRGGILDIWPWAAQHPIRIDFFDDEVDTIRRFDPFTQESFAKLPEIHLSPGGAGLVATETLWSQLPQGPILVLGDSTLQSRLKKAHDRAEVRLARQLEHEAEDAASSTVERLRGDQHRSFKGLEDMAKESVSFLVLARNDEAAQSLREHLDEHGVEAVVTNGRLTHGFRDLEHNLVVVHDFELAHRQRAAKRQARIQGGTPLSSLADLKPGDLVVHLNHGIAKFRGMKTLEHKGYMEDYLLLEFAEESRLYVPVKAIDLIQKYIGGSGRHPPLDKIGGASWKRRKAKAEKSVEDLTGELLTNQAARIAAGGIVFPADDSAQRRFAAAFPYEETEDQLSAIREIKSDMQRPIAMDRLLCGDVGFGKTEIAMRAAFKAAKAGYQVAILAPTTLLAEQHATSFTQRFADWEVNIACLTRFRAGKERKAIMEQVLLGDVDILIGTHALLSKELRFANLGLLIVDEEQRFGVKHKEHLKNLRAGVDVLTLTATPIPRTLHFSMVGLRDISVLAEAPSLRLAIHTRVAPWSKPLLAQALERELEREGQIFVVHNRVQDIDQLALKLSRLVPEMSYAVVHGQMPERELADTMARFKAGGIDCLIATSIIESGIDIPNANTMIVNNAHCFGLSELHQIRGRIGRFTRQAYAYFLVPPSGSIGQEATERLDAIQEYAELGAGFKLAMRDLELRGAGNMLGAEQSGHISAIGYELYCRLVHEAVERQGGDAADVGAAPSKSDGAALAFPLHAYIPDEYCEAANLKFELHKALDDAKSFTQIEEVVRGARDRYGSMPDEMKRLVKVKGLRSRLGELGITRVECEDRHLRLHLSAGIPDVLTSTELPELLHVQADGQTLTLFLRAQPDQDDILDILGRLAHIPSLGL